MSTWTCFRAAALGLSKRCSAPPVVLPRRPHFIAGRPFCSSRVARKGPEGWRRDEDIEFRVVQLADPETGKLSPPEPLRHLLGSIDRKTHFLQLVSTEPPIVRLVSKKEEFDAMRAQRANVREQRIKSASAAEIQMTWAVASADIAHKMKKVRKELERGRRVQLVYAKKRGQRLPPPEAQDTMVNDAVEMVKDIAQERQQREVTPTMTIVHLQPLPKDAIAQSQSAKDEDRGEGVQ